MIEGEFVSSIYSRVLVAAGVSAVLLFGGCSSSKPVNAAGASTKPEKERKAAPDFELKDADGKTVRLSDYKGKIVLLDFWATWCGPCKIEIPWFIQFERIYKDKGFSVIGVAMDEEGWTVVKPFIAEMAINYRVLQGNDGTAQLYGGVEALPTTFLIDREGRIAATHVGLNGKDDFENGIKKLLGTSGIVQERASAGLSGRFVPAVLFGAK
jgi:peroxiredoxin